MPEKAKMAEILLEDQVASYLSENRDFFINRDELISKLELPHAKGQAISLIERQVSILRERNLDSRKQIDQLLDSASRNTEIFDSCRKLILELLEAKDSKQFFRALDLGFKDDFRCTAHHLLLFGNREDGGDKISQFNHFTSLLPEELVRSHIGSILDEKAPYLGTLKDKTQDFLFRHSSGKVKSVAVLSIASQEEEIGVLSIGSADANYFTPEMGTIFLGLIADVLANLLPKFVSLQGNEKG